MFLAPFLSFLLLAGDPAGDAPLVLRSYELSGVLPRPVRYRSTEALFPQVLPVDQEQVRQLSETEDAVPEMLIHLLQPQFPGEFDAEGRFLQLGEDRRLTVRAPEEVQRGVVQLLQNVEGLFQASGELVVDVVRAPSGVAAPASCVVSAAEAEKLLAGAGRERATYRLEVRPGVPALLDLVGTQELVVDYDVEIAQAAAILDPIAVPVPTGQRLQAACAPAPGGTWLALTLRSGEPVGEPREVPLSASGQITTQNDLKHAPSPRALQSLLVENRSLAVNVFLAEGRALVLRTGIDLVDRKSAAWIVVRTGAKPLARDGRLGPVGKAGAPEVRAFQTAFASPWVVRTEYAGLLLEDHEGTRTEPVSRGNLWEGSMQVTLARPATDPLIDLLRNEGPALEVLTWGPWLLAWHAADRGPVQPGELDAIDAALARLGPSPRTFQLGFTLRRGGEQGAVVAQAVLAARAGEPAVLVLGTEQNRVFDYNVEVAQSASVSDPVVVDAFDGLALEAIPEPGFAGETRLALRARARIQRGPVREFEPGSWSVGAVQQAEHDRLAVDQRISFPKDGARVVRLGDTSGGANGLLLEVELAEVR